MKSFIRHILAVIAGLVVGSIVNMLLVNVGPMVFPPPEGADITSMEGLKATIHLFGPQNFIFPFLGHAVGTLVGAVVAGAIAASRKMTVAIVVSCFFLAGAIANVFMLGGPAWFIALDLIAAYVPMGWLGGRMVAGSASPPPAS